MNRERADRAACQPVETVPARHVFHVVAEVIEERFRETPSRLFTNFADRGWRLLVGRLLLILCKLGRRLLILCKRRTCERRDKERQCDSRASHGTHAFCVANGVPGCENARVSSSTVLGFSRLR